MKPPVIFLSDPVYRVNTTKDLLASQLETTFQCGPKKNSQNDTHKNSDDSQNDSDTSTLVKNKPKLQRPSLYKVLLLNDDYTPMEFVVLVLMRYFSKTPQEAERIMMEVHHSGAGLAGIYPFEVAETKVFTVNEFSRRQKHPLKCTMEEQSSEEV